jgi:hypothetical protein
MRREKGKMLNMSLVLYKIITWINLIYNFLTFFRNKVLLNLHLPFKGTGCEKPTKII